MRIVMHIRTTPFVWSKLLLVLVLVLSVDLIEAQVPFCDTETDVHFQDGFDRIIERSGIKSKKRSAPVIEVPLVFHIEENNGVPVISESNLLSKLNTVNTYFSPADVVFTNCAPILFETEASAFIKNSINIYLDDGPSGCGSYSGGRIFINVNCNRTFEHILAHELGHALGLPHTHGYTNLGTTTELVDGSNCSTNGDRFCDTPADPNLLGLVTSGCSYTGTGMDSTGALYAPNIANIMSYTHSNCADHFSTEQLDKMYMVAEALAYECCRIDPPIVSDASICSGETATLTASTNVPTGTIRWFESPKGGSPVGFGTSFTTPVLFSSKSYYVEVLDSCVSERASTLVSVGPEGGLQLLDASIFAKLGAEGQQYEGTPSQLTPLGDTAMIFTTGDRRIYYVDYTMDTVQLVTDHFQLLSGANLSGMLVLPAGVIVATNGDDGPTLWKLDIESGSVTTLHAFGTGYGYSNFWLTAVGDLAFAQLHNDPTGNDGYAELWKTDGSAAGTGLVKDLSPAFPFGNFNFTAFDGKLIFTTETAAHGEELWASDGTTVNTVMVKDIQPGVDGSRPSGFVEADGLLYFTADDGTHGSELWVTDGTSARTNLLVDINVGENGSGIYQIYFVNGYLYFSADNGSDGAEPFKSDGTPEGTAMMVDLNDGGSSSASNFVLYGEDVFFWAYGSGYFSQLYKEDRLGNAGAVLVKSINPSGSSFISNLTVHDDLIFFSASDGQLGTELWQSDGTTGGTQLVLDINPMAASSSPSEFFSLNERLFFVANDGAGTALWSLDVPKYETCFDGSVNIASRNTNSVRWYDAPVGGTLLQEGSSILVENVKQHTIVYAEIEEASCISERYTVPISISNDCPCQGPVELILDQTYTDRDQFVFHALSNLYTPSIFLSGSEMQYKAANSISHQSGFEVQLGAIYQASIEPCVDE